METFVLASILYFLINGLTLMGLLITETVPVSKSAYQPFSRKWYIWQMVAFFIAAFWGAMVL
jgi:hypothetical protein